MVVISLEEAKDPDFELYVAKYRKAKRKVALSFTTNGEVSHSLKVGDLIKLDDKVNIVLEIYPRKCIGVFNNDGTVSYLEYAYVRSVRYAVSSGEDSKSYHFEAGTRSRNIIWGFLERRSSQIPSKIEMVDDSEYGRVRCAFTRFRKCNPRAYLPTVEHSIPMPADILEKEAQHRKDVLERMKDVNTKYVAPINNEVDDDSH